MLMMVFIALMFLVFGRMLGIAWKMTWGFTKVLFRLIFLPLALIAAVLKGLLSIALPVLAVIGLVSLFTVEASA